MRNGVDAVHHRVQIAVVVEIAHGKAARLRRRRNAAAADQAHVFKLPVTQVAVEILALGIGGVHLGTVHFGIDVPVGYQNVEPAVVVDVDEAHAPAQQARVHAQTGLVSAVVEGAVAQVQE